MKSKVLSALYAISGVLIVTIISLSAHIIYTDHQNDKELEKQMSERIQQYENNESSLLDKIEDIK